MRALEFIAETKTTLNKLYGGDFPDRDESFWDYVKSSEFDIPLEVKVLPKHLLNVLLLSQYRVEHIDEIVDLLDDDQRDILEKYINDPSLSEKIILISDDKIIDGNHRALAAAIKGSSIRYVNLEELDESSITENKKPAAGFKTYVTKILVKQPNYSVHMDAMVNAKDVFQARQLFKLQYKVTDSELGSIKEYKL